MPGPELSNALSRLDQAKSLDELAAIARTVDASPATPNVILYSGMSRAARAAAIQETGYSVIDTTDRAALLSNPTFVAKLGELSGVKAGSREELEYLVTNARKLDVNDPNKAAAMAANAALFGIEGDAQALQNSFWGQASAEFVEAASGDVIVMMPKPLQKVFWATELPTMLENPGKRTINGIPAAELAADKNSAFARILPEAQAKAVEFEAKGAIVTGANQQAAAAASAGTAAAAGGASGGGNDAAASNSGSSAGGNGGAAGSGGGGGGGGGGGQPAARIGDLHVCPMFTGPVPHVGGPIALGYPMVLIGGMPAARVGDMATCVGPPDAVMLGSFKVLIGGAPAARMGDPTVHGGTIVLGCPTVLIG